MLVQKQTGERLGSPVSELSQSDLLEEFIKLQPQNNFGEEEEDKLTPEEKKVKSRRKKNRTSAPTY